MTIQYTDLTETIQVDSEGPTADPTEPLIYPALQEALCSGDTSLEWVPDVEGVDCPEQIRALCANCPVQAGCLDSATILDAAGYWAGTNQNQRQHLAAMNIIGAQAIRVMGLAAQVAVRVVPASEQALAVHTGPPSLNQYRNGCRCAGCRRTNSAKQAARRRRRRADEERES
jgi:hypothetical protein